MKKASDEEVKAVLRHGPIEHIVKSFYDDFVELNVRARADAGMKEMVIREALGGCCEWCQKLAGIYEYGKHPKDIFKRHDNCTCLVTFKDEEGYTDAWSKKKFETQREARIARIEQFERKEELLKKSNRNWSIARDEGKNCYDATPEWNAKKAEKQDGKVTEQNYLIIENELHYVDDVHILSGHTEEERNAAKLLVDEFGGEIVLLPRTSGGGIYKDIKSADYLLNGVRIDLKSPKGNGKNTIYEIVKASKKQANTFAIDVSKTPLNLEEIMQQLEEGVFRSDWTKDVETIILLDIKKKKILKVISRV